MREIMFDLLDSAAPEMWESLLGEIEPESMAEDDVEAICRIACEKAGLNGAQQRKPRRWLRVAVAACAALALIGGSLAYAEAKEYREATEFFAHNFLLSDGLSRAEMVIVYQDIASETFANEKTLIVLKDSMVVNYAGTGIELHAVVDRRQEAEQIWIAMQVCQAELSEEEKLSRP